MNRTYTTTLLLSDSVHFEITTKPVSVDWRLGFEMQAVSAPHPAELLKLVATNQTKPKHTCESWLRAHLPNSDHELVYETPLVLVEESPATAVSLKELIATSAVLAAAVDPSSTELVLILAGTIVVLRVAANLGEGVGSVAKDWISILSPVDPPKPRKTKKKK